MDVFVSYSRGDAEAVRRLTADIELGGNRPWSDRELRGGEDWWSRILEQIRGSTAVVLALSDDSLRSPVCCAELAYTRALGIPMIPVQIGEVESLTATLVSESQVIDYREWASGQGIRLMAALAESVTRRKPLPDPLPEPPDAPFAYLLAIAKRIAEPELRSGEQAGLIDQLRRALREEEDDRPRADARRLLHQLRRHPECTYRNAQEIDAALSEQEHPEPAPPQREGTYATSPTPGRPIAVGARPTHLAVTRDGKRIFVANSESKSVSVVDTATGEQARPDITFNTQPSHVAVTPDGRRIYVLSNGLQSVSVLDTVYGTQVGPDISVGYNLQAIAIAPDGRQIYVTSSFSASVSVIDVATGAQAGPDIDVGRHPDGVAVAPDGRRVYVANSGSNSVSTIDTATGAKALPDINVGHQPCGVTVTPDGRQLYVTNYGSNSVSVIDTATGAHVGLNVTVGHKPYGLAITPDGRRAFVANSGSSSVSVIDTATRALIGSTIAVGTNPVAAAVTPDGRRVYVVNSGSDSVSVIDTGLRGPSERPEPDASLTAG